MATDVSRGTCCGIGLSTATDTLGGPAPTWSHPQVTAPLTRVHNGVPACPVQQHRNDGDAPAICPRREKRPERTPVRTDLSIEDSFSSSPAVGRRDWDIRKKGGLVDSKHQIGIYALKEKKGKPRCIEWENLEEDIQLSVRNNREEIEEKEKRGRIKLQASLLAALTEKQERGRENTGETAWKAQICLFIEKDPNEKMNISEDILNAVIPPVWASEIPGRAKNATLVKTELKPGAQSDAAFSIPVDEQSQTIFAFERENATPGRKTQLCCTVLPQGFENGPTSFGKVPAKELELWQKDHDAVTLLQYVDDLLIGSDSYEACLEATTSLLNFLGLAGYPVSKKKA
ncbi:hypothetical protein QYF61_004633 [Mycteria americana]|uniref:ribonuclease H n=1 Tax=Mycteria americana TaxID=33587 RepID=A0AAN7MPX8_MYCAM|nr:hypothetical protein QYF61_004633 [Mycteria americana]